MSQRQGITVHPNRVFVKELPVDVERDELRAAFSGFNFRIRTVRVVETNGSTNYGFLTFDSADEAEEVIRKAKTDQGILIRGKKVSVDHAFSRRNPPRKNPHQFSTAFRNLCGAMSPNIDVGEELQQHYQRQNYGSHYPMSPPPEQQCTSPGSQTQYSPQVSHPHGNHYYPARPRWFYAPHGHGVTAQQTIASVDQNVQWSYHNNSIQGEARPSSQWSVPGNHSYGYDTAGHPQARNGGSHSPYVAQHTEMIGQTYAENPAEGAEAPDAAEWPPHTETAAMQRVDSEAYNGYHHHNQDSSHHDQSQLHHQTQLMHQHVAQQHQNLMNAHYIQYAQCQPQLQTTRRDSVGSTN